MAWTRTGSGRRGISLPLPIRPASGPSSVPVAAVHAVIREQIPAMNVDREVSAQITAVDATLAEVCATAAASCGGLG